MLKLNELKLNRVKTKTFYECVQTFAIIPVSMSQFLHFCIELLKHKNYSAYQVRIASKLAIHKVVSCAEKSTKNEKTV